MIAALESGRSPWTALLDAQRLRPGDDATEVHQIRDLLDRLVADSVSWRRFARIDIDGKVPHPTTLRRITTRCGPQAIAELNETLLAKANEQKRVKTGTRADTTVVSANIRYPTESGLLAHAVSKIGNLMGRARAAGAGRDPYRVPRPVAGRFAAGTRHRGQAQAACCRRPGAHADAGAAADR